MRRLLALALLHLARTAADASTAERIRSGQTSSLEEVSRRLARAYRHDDDLRAFVSIFGAEALRAAAARDEEAARRVLDGAGGRLELDGRLHFEDREELVGSIEL